MALLGAITHQALAVCVPSRAGQNSFVASLRRVRPAGYTSAIIVLYLLTVVMGLIIYPNYRIGSHDLIVALRRGQLMVGIFDIKEQFVAIGLGILPGYWYYWRKVAPSEAVVPRRALTLVLTVIVWWAFLVGHVVNNLAGVGV
ncbi:MAG TPA: hypothetical protein VN577_22930 [Terriglobales bacterium]|nr:hypothetical protein [Terriglobales bacterium]